MKLVQCRVPIKPSPHILPKSHSTYSGEVQPLVIKPVVYSDYEEAVHRLVLKFASNGAVDNINELRGVRQKVRYRSEGS